LYNVYTDIDLPCVVGVTATRAMSSAGPALAELALVSPAYLITDAGVSPVVGAYNPPPDDHNGLMMSLRSEEGVWKGYGNEQREDIKRNTATSLLP